MHYILQQNGECLIQIEDGSIHIVCDDETLRVKIRDATLSSLQRISAAKIPERPQQFNNPMDIHGSNM